MRSLDALVDAQLPYWQCLARLNREELTLALDEATNKTETAAATDAMASLTMQVDLAPAGASAGFDEAMETSTVACEDTKHCDHLVT